MRCCWCGEPTLKWRGYGQVHEYCTDERCPQSLPCRRCTVGVMGVEQAWLPAAPPLWPLWAAGRLTVPLPGPPHFLFCFSPFFKKNILPRRSCPIYFIGEATLEVASPDLEIFLWGFPPFSSGGTETSCPPLLMSGSSFQFWGPAFCCLVVPYFDFTKFM